MALSTVQKANTPGCNVEASAFRDGDSADAKAGVVVLGVRPDSVESHKKFEAKFNLPVPLLADEGHRVAEAHGAWAEKKRPGGTRMGILRTRFLIGAAELLVKVFEKVKPDGHSQAILGALPSA